MKKSKKSINAEGGNVRGGGIFFFKFSKCDFTFIREWRVNATSESISIPIVHYGITGCGVFKGGIQN